MRKLINGILLLTLVCGLMSVNVLALDNMPTKKVEVGIEATEIVPANYSRKTVMIEGDLEFTIDNSETDVSTNTWRVAANVPFKLEGYQGAIWGIVAASTSTVKVLELQY